MKPRRLLISQLTVLLTTGTTVVLLVANCAKGPTCAESTFKREYAVTTTCGGAHTGRLRVNFKGVESYASVPFAQDGDLPVQEVVLDGQCAEGGKATFQKLILDVGPGHCEVELGDGKATDTTCLLPDAGMGDESCAMHLEPM